MSQTEIEVGTEVAAPVGMDVEKLMALAIEKEGAIEVIERLAQLRNDEMAREAEHRFGEAFAEFKRLCPPIPRTKRGAGFAGAGGVKEYVMYAPLDGIQGVVDPILNDVGLSYWWDSSASEKSVVTTCVLRHVGGHERRSAMALPVSGPPKSSVTQAHAGTRSFNKRLTLSDVLGIQTVDDVDGQDVGEHTAISADQLLELQELVNGRDVDIDRFLEYVGVDSLKSIPEASFGMAQRTLLAKKPKS